MEKKQTKLPFHTYFYKMWRKFCCNTSLSGYRYMVDEKRSHFERRLWEICHVILIASTVYLTANLWISFMDNPTVTTLKSTNYPVSEVIFPGVALCNLNKVSLKRARKLAAELSNLTKIDSGTILQHLYYLGRLIDVDTAEIDKTLQAQHFFDTYKRKLPIDMHVYSLIKQLTIPCEELLHNCRWAGQQVNCSDIFEFRLTYEGFCCTFNYLKPKFSFEGTKSADNTTREPKFQLQMGPEYGLSVEINNDLDDYFYTALASVGVTLMIFQPLDYADITSGSLIESIIDLDSENFLSIIPTVFETTHSIIRYSLSKRKCVFAEEKRTKFGEYSQSDCMVDCRLKSMLALCDCAPFFIPMKNTDLICNLNDIECLNKYREKWGSVIPFGIDEKDEEYLKKELFSSLDCQECLPACDGILYQVMTNKMPLKRSENYNKGQTNSVVHVYFQQSFANFYQQDVVFYWFEILSNFGGIFGLMIGLSLISVIEIVIFFTSKLIQYLMQR